MGLRWRLWRLGALSACLGACGTPGEPDPSRIPIFAGEQLDPIPNEPLPFPELLVCPRGTPLTYENFGQPFLLDYCTSCHSASLTTAQRSGAPAAANFDSHGDVLIWRAKIIEFAVVPETATMPPGRVLGERERAQLGEWLYCGAPGDADSLDSGDAPPPPADDPPAAVKLAPSRRETR